MYILLDGHELKVFPSYMYDKVVLTALEHQ